MSTSLVKKSLQLFGTTESSNADKCTKQPEKVLIKSKSIAKKKSRKGALDVRTSMIEKVERIRKQVKEKYDFTEKNLYLLKSLSSHAVDEKDASKIFKRARKEEEVEIVKPEEKTVFTEEDFQMFEREYIFE